MECEARIFLSNCNCVLYYMPRFHEDITICGRSDNVCVNEVNNQLRSKTNSSFVCECLPGCYALFYDTEISLSPLLARSPLLQRKKLLASNTAMMHIYYKEQSTRSQKKEGVFHYGHTVLLHLIETLIFDIFRTHRIHGIFEQHRRLVGLIHGLLSYINQWTVLLYDHSAVL